MENVAATDQLLRSSVLREMRYAGALKTLSTHLERLENLMRPEGRNELLRIQREISDVVDDSSMAQFEHVFEVMHGGYLQRLANDFPALTPAELRLSAFLRLPIPSKEVARLFSCSVRSIEKHRERMRKKFRLVPSENLTTFLAARY